MANQSTAYGLRPIGLVGSASNSTGVTQYEIASNNTNAIYQYGIVVPTANGVIDYAGATDGGTTQALGVLMGVEYQDSVQKKPVFLIILLFLLQILPVSYHSMNCEGALYYNPYAILLLLFLHE